MSAQVSNDIQITKSDQDAISSFAKAHSAFKDLNEEVKVLDTKIDKLDDCITEIEMEDDDAKMQVKLGDGFVFLTIEKAREMFEKEKIVFEEELKVKKAAAKELSKRCDGLKSGLKAKFGNKINLDEG